MSQRFRPTPLAVWLLLAIFWGLATDVSHGQRTTARVTSDYSLDDCVGIALTNHPLIGAAVATRDATGENIGIARAAFRPKIGFEARYSAIDEPRSANLDEAFAGDVADVFSDAAAFFQIARQTNSATAAAALDNPNLPPFSLAKQAALNSISNIEVHLLGESFLTTQLLLVQPLWTGGKISNRFEQAELSVAAADQDVIRTKQQLAFNVSRAYFAVLLSQELLRVTEDAAGHARAVERLANAMSEEGVAEVSTADVLRARAFRQFFEEQRVGMRRGVQRAYTRLKLAIGFDQIHEVQIADRSLPLSRRSLTYMDLHDLALSRRPELAQTDIATRATYLEQRIAKAAYLPDVALFGGLTTIHDDQDFPNPNDSEEWMIGVTAQVPVYQGGQRAAQVRKAEWSHARAHHLREQALLMVGQEVRDAFLEYQEMGERIEAAKQSVASARQALKAFDNMFVGDQLTDEQMPKYFENSLSTRFLLVNSQVKYNQAVFGYNLALARLRFVTASEVLPEDAEELVAPGRIHPASARRMPAGRRTPAP